MNLAISNIAWKAKDDNQVYEIMEKYNFSGLEIAPTRIIPQNPYDHIKEVAAWKKHITDRYGFQITSMQSIWFGRQEKLFGSEKERETLFQYTKKAVDFAAAIECKNLVFGCPKNRILSESMDSQVGVDFFRAIGEYAYEKGTVIAMEANPTIYGTNYINDTLSALELVKEVDSKGFLLNLDLGTVIYNDENVEELRENVRYINHVHVSEPELKPIEERKLHKQLKELVLEESYEGFVSIEMGKVNDISILEEKMEYVDRIMNN